MKWNGIERNKLDFILTDLLPVELSELFSFKAFYSFLLEREQKKIIQNTINSLKKTKAKANKILFERGWHSIPLKYNILKGTNSTREMSIIHPFSALNLYLFIECYQKDILNFFKEKHCFSIRYHKKSTDLFYKSKIKKITQYFQSQSQKTGKEAIQQVGNYFKIGPFESLNTFSDSRIWQMCNFKYRFYAKIDYKSCFDSIYTHSYKWIIQQNVIDSKSSKNSHLFMTIDRILQNINGLSSNGLIVGPEFSRMIAEILLQEIDSEVMYSLSNDGITHNKDYDVFRYVDDIFIFANEQAIIDKIIEKYQLSGKQYLLHLNELKLVKGETPCLPKKWLEKTRSLSDLISSFFYQGTKYNFDNLPENERFLVKTTYIPIDRLKDEISDLIKSYTEDRKTIVSFLLSALYNNISKKKDGYTLFGNRAKGKGFLLLELMFYIYAFYPSFDQTRKITSMIVYLNDEINFKNKENPDMYIKLSKIISRYSFIFENNNLFDLCDWFPFLLEYNISLSVKLEDNIIKKAEMYNDPILWGNLLLYSNYHKQFFNTLKSKIEDIIKKQISNITIGKDIFLYKEFWYILIFYNCKYIDDDTKNLLIKTITTIESNIQNQNKPSDDMARIVCDFMLKSNQGFFNWENANNFSKQITYRTFQRTIFKKYNKNKYNLYASID